MMHAHKIAPASAVSSCHENPRDTHAIGDTCKAPISEDRAAREGMIFLVNPRRAISLMSDDGIRNEFYTSTQEQVMQIHHMFAHLEFTGI